METVQLIALSMGVAWASGINLYAAIAVLGILGGTGNLDLPPGLEVLQHPGVIVAAGFMYCVEFFADKVPGVDTGWDTLHTFIRIPAAAVLAAGAVGEVDPAVTLMAGILGGALAATSHTLKAGTRVLINTSPEPFSNIGVSVAEDTLVLAGLAGAVFYPVEFLVFLAIFLAAAIWLLPKIWRGVRFLFARLRRAFEGGPSPAPPSGLTLKRISAPNGARMQGGA
ncbi:MAG: DUF4126 domain-containing protein [Kiloniellales bacterium]|nr:DUF4126 domain-containing protein [Kiloniellales bacterium]